eukprot:7380922-Heterocapsa_arctica.AAC.1
MFGAGGWQGSGAVASYTGPCPKNQGRCAAYPPGFLQHFVGGAGQPLVWPTRCPSFRYPGGVRS